MNKISKGIAFAMLVACAAVLPAFAADQQQGTGTGTMFGGTPAPVHAKAMKKMKKTIKSVAPMGTQDKK